MHVSAVMLSELPVGFTGTSPGWPSITDGGPLPQVLVQGLILQLWAPLSSVGGLYRRLRKALVDLEDLIAVLRTQPALTDGQQEL